MFFAVFLFLKSINVPNPELTNNPESNAPKDKEPLINSSVINKLEAQLGINPIMAVNNGAKYRLVWMKLVKFSSPMKPIRKPNAKLIARTYPNISKE